LFALLAAACSDATPSAADEIAGELRALRLALAQQPARASETRPQEVVDLQAALQPLRGALEGLAASQRELAERQVALAQELQRWSQLLVDSVTGARADEARVMAKKLQEFEAQLKSQDARHREVEALIQGALDHTADRLDDFLKRLQSPPANAPARAPGGDDKPHAPEQTANGNEHERQAAADGAVRHGGGAAMTRWWWLALTCAGASAAMFFLRRAGRPPRAELAAPLPPTASGNAAPGEQSVEEIWAAAALLGEAVGRLRQSTGDAPAAAPLVPLEPSPHEELFCVEEDLEPGLPSPAARSSEPASAPPAAPPGPETIAMVLAGAGEVAVREALAGERLVLRRPAPSVRAGDGGVAVRFHVVPDLSAAERVRLLQRLRDAVRRAE
jgi:hypothetical protein